MCSSHVNLRVLVSLTESSENFLPDLYSTSNITLHHTTSHYVTSRHITSHHIMSRRITSHHVACFFILHLSLLQSNYSECVLLILLKHPDQIDTLLSLTFSDRIEEAKMQSLMEHISKNNATMLLQIISRLASNTSSAGMELLRYN